MPFIPFLGVAAGLAGFVAIMGFCVVAHELGHFLAARALGLSVARFSVGFGRELLGRTDRHGTRWSLSAVPLGGYVRFGGRREAAEGAKPKGLARLLGEDTSDDLSRAAPWRTFLVVLAGPAASVVFAVLVFFAVNLVLGVQVQGMRVVSVEPDGPAALAGVVAGDEIASFEGISDGGIAREKIAAMRGETARLVVVRGGVERPLTLVVGSRTIETPMGPRSMGRIGVAFAPPVVGRGVVLSARSALRYVAFLASETVGFFTGVFHAKVALDDFSTPVGIAAISGGLLVHNLTMFVRFMGAISFGLGVTNMLPIPGLDGGRCLFAAIEVVASRRLPVRFSAAVSACGILAVLGFVLFLMGRESLEMLAHSVGR